jgi:hypothetical protein
MINIDLLSEIYKIQQTILCELSNLDNPQKVKDYLKRNAEDIDLSIYKKCSLDESSDLSFEGTSKKLVSVLFVISKLLLKVVSLGCERTSTPWITFVILNPEYPDNDEIVSKVKTSKYLFYSFGVDDNESPMAWYRFLERSQSDYEVNKHEGFVLSSLILEKIDKQFIENRSIFRIFYHVNVDSTAEKISSLDNIKFNDIHIINSNNQSPDPNEFISCTTHNQTIREGFEDHIKAVKESMDSSEESMYIGLIEYIENINRYMGVDTNENWTLYGFPILSCLTDLTIKTPHSGVYILSESGINISDAVTEQLHAILIATLYPIDQLYLIRELQKSITYKEQLSRVGDYASDLLKYVKPLQNITEAIENIAVIIDPKYWTPGMSDYKKLQKKLYDFFEMDNLHKVSSHEDIEELDKLLKNAAFAKAKENFISKGISSSLIENKVFEKMMHPWEHKYIKDNWRLAIYLAKALSRLKQLPVYWLHIALLEDPQLEERPSNIHEYFFLTAEADHVISCLIAISKLQLESTISSVDIVDDKLKFNMTFPLEDGKNTIDLDGFIQSIKTMKSGDKNEHGGQSTRAFKVLINAGMKVLDAKMVNNKNGQVDVCFELNKMR